MSIQQQKKRLVFEKGVTTIRIPFMLNDFSPWQDQVREQIENIQQKYSYRKDAKIGFSITSLLAEITLSIK